ncbi:MAG: hypothetical protein IJ092_02575 [Atopobiaceae bacterium]|nr:hypothetical protein [Atopobiaceae bacterium]MBR1830762.1 hypothetical protein [Atopobiaceae bacterium]
MYEHVYSSTQLKTNLREIKDIAKNNMVYITENGVISYFFCSVEVYNDLMDKIAKRASWEASVGALLDWADEDTHEDDVLLDDHTSASMAFLEGIRMADYSLDQPNLRCAIEYVSKDPKVGMAISKDVVRKAPKASTPYKYYCSGYDIIYEHDEETGKTVLCGFVESSDSFDLPPLG